MYNMRKSKAHEMAYGGAAVALIGLIIYSVNLLQYNKLAALSLTSLIIAFIFIKFGYRTAAVTYAASSAAVFILSPNKLIFAAFFVFFGNYALIKAYAEEKRIYLREYIIKYLHFNLALLLAYILYRTMLLSGAYDLTALYTAAAFIGLQILFFIYDRIMSFLISIIYRKMVKFNI